MDQGGDWSWPPKGKISNRVQPYLLAWYQSHFGGHDYDGYDYDGDSTVAFFGTKHFINIQSDIFMILSDEVYGAGIAVDDIDIFDCALPAGQVVNYRF